MLLPLNNELYAKPYSKIAKEANQYNVLIEGIQSGSGVIIEKEGNIYKVITAKHVISDLKKGDEIDLKTFDGKWHSVILQSIEKIDNVDLAIMDFYSKDEYPTAIVGKSNSIEIGSEIFVSGYALPSASVPDRVYRFIKGNLISYSNSFIEDGYQLLYSNKTLPGMSGGSVINIKGEVVGIHGRGETDFLMTEQRGIAIKTGTNQAIPLTYYRKFIGEISELNEDFDIEKSNKIAFKKSQELLDKFRLERYSTTFEDFYKDGEKAREDLLSSLKRRIQPIIEKEPNEPKANFFTGIINFHEQKYENALINFENSRKMGNEDSQLLKWLALTHYNLNNNLKAQRYIKDALTLNPEDEESLFWYSNFTWEAKDIEIFDNLIRNSKNKAILFSSKRSRCGLSYEKNDPRVIDFCEEYLNIAPPSDFLRWTGILMESYIKSNNSNKEILKGIALANKVLKTYPKDLYFMWWKSKGFSIMKETKQFSNEKRYFAIEQISSRMIKLLEGRYDKDFNIDLEDLNWYKASAYDNRGLARQMLIPNDVNNLYSNKKYKQAKTACKDRKTAANLDESFYQDYMTYYKFNCEDKRLIDNYAPWKNPNSTYCLSQKANEWFTKTYDKRCS